MENPAPPGAGDGSASSADGAAGASKDVYTLIHNALTGDDPVTEIKVRPIPKPKGGAAGSLTGPSKLAPRIEIVDQPGSPTQVIGNQVVATAQQLLSDEAGDYWLIQAKLNPQAGVKLEDFCRQYAAHVFSIKVTVYLQFGQLMGQVSDLAMGMAGMPGLAQAGADLGAPAGGLQVPVAGATKLRLRANQWKVSFSKFMWQKQEDTDVAKLKDTDAAALENVCRYGGTVEVCLDGGIKLPVEKEEKKEGPEAKGEGKETHESEAADGEAYGDAAAGVEQGSDADGDSDSSATDSDVVGEGEEGNILWNDKGIVDAEIDLTGPMPDKIRGEYDEQRDVYRFTIPAPDGSQSASGLTARIPLEVWADQNIQNRLRGMAEKAAKANEVLEGTLVQDAEKFIQACLDYLATNKQATLHEQAEKFTGATHGITYFMGFTAIAAEAFKQSLEAHKEAYDRYKENLVAVFMELIFWAVGEHSTEKMYRKIIKDGKEGAAAELKREAKTLAQTAAEKTEVALAAKLTAEKAARDQARSVYGNMTRQLSASQAEIASSLAKIPALGSAKQEAERELEQAALTIKQLSGITVRPGVRIPVQPGITEALETYRKANTRIADLERSIADTFQSVADRSASARGLLRSMTAHENKMLEIETRYAALAPQADFLRKVKVGAASQEEYEALIKQAAQEAPSGRALFQQAQKALREEGQGFEVLQAYKKQLELTLTQAKAPRAVANVKAALEELEETLRPLERAELASESILTQYVGWTADTLKDNFNEHAKKLREQLDALEKANFNCKNWFDNAFWRGCCDLAKAMYDTAGEVWSWLTENGKSAVEWAKGINPLSDDTEMSEVMGAAIILGVDGLCNKVRDVAPAVLSCFSNVSFLVITAVVVVLDLILQGLMKLCEALLWFANSPKFASSRLTLNARLKVEKSIVKLPATLPEEFFKFSQQLTRDMAEKLKPENVLGRSGGKEAVGKAIKDEFAGAYQDYHRAQWEAAAAYMRTLAGAEGALSPEWLDKLAAVRANNRDATRLLQSILHPLDQYMTSFTRPADNLGTVGGFMSDAYYFTQSDEWSAQDIDVLLEKLGNLLSLGLKIVAAIALVGGLLTGCVPAIGWSVSAMEAGGPSDQMWAIARLWTVMYATMPHVLGIQFDVMRVFTLCYQGVFYNADLSEAALADKPLPGSDWLRDPVAMTFMEGPMGGGIGTGE